MESDIKVCIVGLKCYDILKGGGTPRYLGGIETQLAVLAKGLVRLGCETSVVTFDHGQGENQVFDGVRVHPAYPPQGGLPVVRQLWRTMRLGRAMEKSGANVFLQMGAGAETGQTAFGCRKPRNGARFVFCMASDTNFGASLHAGLLGWEGRAYRYGLRRASLIVAQTVRQKEGLLESTGLVSNVIPMGVISPLEKAGLQRRLSGEKRVLWIGRVIETKRLEWLLEAARVRPEISFDVVGSPNKESEYARKVMETARTVKNVVVHGKLPDDELARVYQNCSVLCCTSTLEGFPTTFLEAWSCGIPVVTTFDPDGVVERNRLGFVARTREEVSDGLGKLCSSPELYDEFSRRVLSYFASNHSMEAVSARFLEAFRQLA